MAHCAIMENRILGLCDEANALLFANLLDTKKVGVLRKRLSECADQARDACHENGEERLRPLAVALADRFPPMNE